MTIADTSGVAEYQRLRRATQRGDLIRLKQGVYATPSALIDTMLDIDRLVPQGVVCLYSAWAYYQLTMEVQPAFCVAIEAKRKVVLPSDSLVRLYYWQKKNLEFGISEAEISGHHVRITDLERSVCDAIKYRNKIGMDTCSEILKNYVKRNDRNLSLLNQYARNLRLSSILNQYLTLLLAE